MFPRDMFEGLQSRPVLGCQVATLVVHSEFYESQVYIFNRESIIFLQYNNIMEEL